MKFTSILIVYVSHFLVGNVISMSESAENSNGPCIGCELQRILGMEPTSRHSSKPRHNPPPVPSHRSSGLSFRSDEMMPEEREERINRGFARFMQLLTFMGHVDNYLTDKASGLIRTMGRAMEYGDDQEYEESPYDRISRRQAQPKMKTTITS